MTATIIMDAHVLRLGGNEASPERGDQVRWANLRREAFPNRPSAARARVLQRVATIIALAVSLGGCNVEARGGSTGGLGPSAPDAGDGAGPEAPDAGPMGPTSASASVRGFAVVNTDFTSSSVSLVDLEGEVQSGSFIASSSAAAGLSAALSGDVALPASRASGSELLLIDRDNAVLSWVELATGEVRAQLNVSTGFASNPQDYVPVAGDKAFLTRHDPNLDSGEQPFDGGSDVLILDPSAAEITGGIDLRSILEGEPEDFFPRPGRALMAGGLLRVLALGFNATFSESLDSRIVSIDPQTNEIADVLVFEGMRNCGGLALSPAGTELAVACSGAFGQDPEDGFPDSGILTLAVASALQEGERFPAVDLGGERINALSYASDARLAFTTFGRFNDDFTGQSAPDTARTLDLATGNASAPLRESVSMPFSLGDFLCAAEVCLLTDLETQGGVLHRFEVDGAGALVSRSQFATDAALGLPPASLGVY